MLLHPLHRRAAEIANKEKTPGVGTTKNQKLKTINTTHT
jgi:hypothetical protein